MPQRLQIHDFPIAAECGNVVDGPDNVVAVEQRFASVRARIFPS